MIDVTNMGSGEEYLILGWDITAEGYDTLATSTVLINLRVLKCGQEFAAEPPTRLVELEAGTGRDELVSAKEEIGYRV